MLKNWNIVWPKFAKDLIRSQFNLVPRVSSLLYLYSGMQEAIRQSDWLFAILRGNSVLRGVNCHGMSKLPYCLLT